MWLWATAVCPYTSQKCEKWSIPERRTWHSLSKVRVLKLGSLGFCWFSLLLECAFNWLVTAFDYTHSFTWVFGYTVRSINIGKSTQFSSFWLYTPPQWIWNETNKMCFMCRLSVLIWGYLHPNQVNGVGIKTVSICASHFLRDQK